ncbi:MULTISPECIES: helix-turn-helix domain-containing protein [Nocardiaceae]|jgi:transcriptional regulator with XRE-family HTH domain|uniref:helix-turn-helix domain-containing protein n=1 Tax=Nocardiaceae TaxID=85025 RepID=UPI00037D839B|nr:helix-turn-helix transcriptional regulator [Nocardia sp. 348MFTsu5.1]
MALLLREALGGSLRRVRMDQGRTLREVSTSARVSLGYLSEVERGQKEASSELLAAICDALEVEIADVLLDVRDTLRTDLDRVSPSSAHTSIATETKVVIPQPASALAAA